MTRVIVLAWMVGFFVGLTVVSLSFHISIDDFKNVVLNAVHTMDKVNENRENAKVYRIVFNDVEDVKPIDKFDECKPLPNELIIKPGIYIYSGKAYKFDKEGLYRILIDGKIREQRIVFKDNITVLLSSIAWIHTHGNRDDGLPYFKLKEKAKHSKLFLTCGYISKFTHEILNELGVKSRIANGCTLHNLTGYDDGHVMIEVFTDGKWILYDIDNNCYFEENKTPLSFIEFWMALRNDENFSIRYLAKDIRVDTEFPYLYYAEIKLTTERGLKNWYKRVVEVPRIYYNGIYYYTTMNEKEKEKYERLHNVKYLLTKYLDYKTFINTFYNSSIQ